MNKKLLNKLKEKLEKERLLIETDLKSFATEDKNLKGDWDTRFPEVDGGVGSQALEDAADQVEEYATLLPIEYSLEIHLQRINEALKKIKKGKYGKCESCGKKIEEKRLKAYPAVKLCASCQKKLKTNN